MSDVFLDLYSGSVFHPVERGLRLFDTAYVMLLPLIMHYDLFLCLSVNHVVVCHFGPG